MMPDADLLGDLLRAAENHGKAGDPEHEVGDLEALIDACWERLTPEQRREIYAELPPERWLEEEEAAAP